MGNPFVLVKSFEVPVEIGCGVFPFERNGSRVVPVFEGKQPLLHGGEIGEVVGREHFTLDDRKVDLD